MMNLDYVIFIKKKNTDFEPVDSASTKDEAIEAAEAYLDSKKVIEAEVVYMPEDDYDIEEVVWNSKDGINEGTDAPVEDDEDSAWSEEEVRATLIKMTNNFKKNEGEITTYFEEEKDHIKNILDAASYQVEVSDGRKSEDDEMSWVITFVKKVNESLVESAKPTEFVEEYRGYEIFYHPGYNMFLNLRDYYSANIKNRHRVAYHKSLEGIKDILDKRITNKEDDILQEDTNINIDKVDIHIDKFKNRYSKQDTHVDDLEEPVEEIVTDSLDESIESDKTLGHLISDAIDHLTYDRNISFDDPEQGIIEDEDGESPFVNEVVEYLEDNYSDEELGIIDNNSIEYRKWYDKVFHIVSLKVLQIISSLDESLELNELFGLGKKKEGELTILNPEQNKNTASFAKQIFNKILNKKYNVIGLDTYSSSNRKNLKGTIQIVGLKNDITKKLNKEISILEDHMLYTGVTFQRRQDNPELYDFELKIDPDELERRDQEYLDDMTDRYLISSHSKKTDGEELNELFGIGMKEFKFKTSDKGEMSILPKFIAEHFKKDTVDKYVKSAKYVNGHIVFKYSEKDLIEKKTPQQLIDAFEVDTFGYALDKTFSIPIGGAPDSGSSSDDSDRPVTRRLKIRTDGRIDVVEESLENSNERKSIDEIAEICGGYEFVVDVIDNCLNRYPGINDYDEIADMTYDESTGVDSDEWSSLIEYVCETSFEHLQESINEEKLDGEHVRKAKSPYNPEFESIVDKKLVNKAVRLVLTVIDPYAENSNPFNTKKEFIDSLKDQFSTPEYIEEFIAEYEDDTDPGAIEFVKTLRGILDSIKPAMDDMPPVPAHLKESLEQKYTATEFYDYLEENGIEEGCDIILDWEDDKDLSEPKTIIEWLDLIIDTYIDLEQDLFELDDFELVKHNRSTVIKPLIRFKKDLLRKDTVLEHDYGCDKCGKRVSENEINWFYGAEVGICDDCNNKMTDDERNQLDNGEFEVLKK